MFRFLLAAALVAAPAMAASPTAIEAHTRFLSDDLLEGRGMGVRGHEIAVAYVASQFAALGLTPAGTDGWMQRITFQRRSQAGARETLTLTRGGTAVFVNGPDLAVGPGTAAGSETVEAGLVFVGFGLDAPTLGIDDYAGLDVRGKIVVAVSGAPLGLDSEVGASLAASKGEAAAKRGAVGLVQVRSNADVARRGWDKIGPSARRPAYNWLNPDGSIDPAATALRFAATANDRLATALFEGAPATFAAVRAEVSASPQARPKGFALSGTLRLDRATALDRITSPNVVALLPGSKPVLRDEVVLLTAHADHLGIRPHPSGDTIYNGAQDNAAGVAMLLEAARDLAAGKRPARSVMFLVTTGEEVGLQGADYFARHPTVALPRIVSEVDLDMPILTCRFGTIVPYGASHSTMGRDVAAVAAKMGVGISPDPQPIEAIFTRSDHYRLVRAGVPALFIKTGPGDDKGGNACGAADKAFRATQYHEPSDDMSLPFDWAAAARFTDLNVALTRRIADARVRPRWYAGDFFGETFAKGAAKAVR